MSIYETISGVETLLQRLKQYQSLIDADNFETNTVTDMKDNAKALCDTIKGDMDDIKDDIDEWS